MIETGTIVIDGNRIGQSVRPPPCRCRRARAGGRQGQDHHAGLIDVHGHLGGESAGLIGEASWPLMTNLAFGVTTSHDPSNDSETVFTNAELVRAGAKMGPRVYSTGTILYGAETPFKAVVESYDDALSHLRRQKAMAPFSIKNLQPAAARHPPDAGQGRPRAEDAHVAEGARCST